MKKLMMIAAMMVATMTANAQFEPGTFSIQPKLGGTGAWLTNMPDLDVPLTDYHSIKLDKQPTGGFIIGGEVEYQLTKMFSIAAGVNYAQQGSGWKDEDLNINGVKMDIKDAKIELAYVNVPLVLNAYLFKGFAVKTGVQFGFLTSADLKATMRAEKGNVSNKVEFDKSVKEDFKKFDLSIPVGVSYEFKVPIVIDMRYNIGLLDINKNKEQGDPTIKNQMLQITAGYKFAL
jgi:hypothetical protein